jgi:hypothetical protein
MPTPISFRSNALALHFLGGAFTLMLQSCGSADSVSSSQNTTSVSTPSSVFATSTAPPNTASGTNSSTTANESVPVQTSPLSPTTQPPLVAQTPSGAQAPPTAPSPSSPPTPSPSATLQTNHAGRVLSAMPTIKSAIQFNTAEADAILSAMQIMPKNSAWNEDISARPVLTNSTAMIANIGSASSLAVNMDMGFVIVPPSFAKQDFSLTLYADESDPGPYPIPDNTPIENWPLDGSDLSTLQGSGTGDRHAIIVDPSEGMIYELGEALKTNGRWTAIASAKFKLTSNDLRPLGWTSTDAAGLPIFPAIVRYDELARGAVEHAMRFTVKKSRQAYIYPASHYASNIVDANFPAMGQRFRLKNSANLAGLPPHALVIAKGLQTYGMIVADNGGNWRISVAPDARITGLDALSRFKGSDFEVIQTTGEFEGPRAK